MKTENLIRARLREKEQEEKVETAELAEVSKRFYDPDLKIQSARRLVPVGAEIAILKWVLEETP